MLANAAQPQDSAAKIAQVERGLTTPVVIAGQAPPAMTLQRRMQHYHIPAVSIAFFDASGVRWARAYGATTHTLFQAGSISKPVSAAGIMRLVQDGRLSLDANVNGALRGWKVPDNAFTAKQPVTLRELLSHTAGTTIHGFDGYERGKPLPTLEQVLDGVSPANSTPIRVDLQPGTQFRYSGGGYVIAEKLVADTIDEPFAAYMRKSVLEPLGMTDSTFEQPLPENLWNRVAPASDREGKPYPGGWHVYPEQTAAGLWTTATDLAKFAIGVQRALDGSPNAILSPATATEMLTPVKDHYGLGFEVTGTGRTARFGHDGANAGYQALFVMHRGGQGVAIMTDSDNGLALIQELLPSIGAAYGWSEYAPKRKKLYPLAPQAYARFTGRYNAGGEILSVVQKGPALYLSDPQGEERLYPESPTKFFMLEQDIDIEFVSDSAGGAVTGMSFGRGVAAEKLPPDPPVVQLDAATLASYPGTYAAGGVTMVVTVAGTHVFAKLADQPSFEIFPSARDEFYYTVVNAQVTFTRSARGEIAALVLHQNGQDITFTRSP